MESVGVSPGPCRTGRDKKVEGWDYFEIEKGVLMQYQGGWRVRVDGDDIRLSVVVIDEIMGSKTGSCVIFQSWGTRKVVMQQFLAFFVASFDVEVCNLYADLVGNLTTQAKEIQKLKSTHNGEQE